MQVDLYLTYYLLLPLTSFFDFDNALLQQSQVSVRFTVLYFENVEHFVAASLKEETSFLS